MKRYKAAVMGAGPAGLAVVSTLLDSGITGGILWVDPAFQAGRLSIYDEVPSNTRVKLFEKYAQVSPTLASLSTEALEPFKDLDPDRGCGLGRAQHMVKSLSHGILAQHKDKVDGHVGIVSLIRSLKDGSCWKLDDLGVAEQVYLCTGSHPKGSVLEYVNPRARSLNLDDVLIPSRLPNLVTSSDVIGVVGSSHSAVLCLRNLLESKVSPRVINLYRSPLLYAVHLPDGRIMHDNTGLKGIAADWARERLEAGVFERAGRLERVCIKDSPETVVQALDRCSAVVHAVGFSRNPLPAIVREDGTPFMHQVVHDTKSGHIVGAQGIRGFGIAFPETVVDPSGHASSNVGLWKFMRYIREQLL